MARLPAAPGAYGQPPVPPVEASKQRMPSSSAAVTLASAVPRVSWKCIASRSGPTPSATSAPTTRRTSAGPATPIVSPMLELVDAEREQPVGDVDHCRLVDLALVRAAEGGADVAAAPPAALARRLDDRAGRRRSTPRSLMLMLCRGERLGRGGEDADGVGPGCLRAVEARARSARAPGTARRAVARAGAISSSASASCGIALGDTKLVASISRRPASASRSMKRSFASVAIGAASFWSPSRGPTS